MRVVLDNSVTLGWIHAEQATAYADGVLNDLTAYTPLAPALWPLEFANALLVLKRRRKLSEPQRRAALVQAGDWNIAIDVEPPRAAAISDLALEHGLSAYDAAYLDCSLRHRARLATQDAALKNAAKKLHCWYEPTSV